MNPGALLADATRIAARRQTEHELKAVSRRLDELLDRLDRLADPPRDVVLQWGNPDQEVTR